jgi:hypothetical protein
MRSLIAACKGFTSACDLYTKFGQREVNAARAFCARVDAGLTEKKQGFLAQPPYRAALLKMPCNGAPF